MSATYQQSRLRDLTDGERTVLDATLEGDKNVKIAAQIGVSLRTVERLRAAAIRKLGARSIVEAVRLVASERQFSDDPKAELMAVAFRTAPAPTLVVDFGGQIVAINDAFGQMLGYREGELVGRRCIEVTHPDDIAEDLAYCGRLTSEKIPPIPRRKRFLDRRGQPVAASVAVSIAWGSTGTPMFCVGQVLPAM